MKNLYAKVMNETCPETCPATIIDQDENTALVLGTDREGHGFYIKRAMRQEDGSLLLDFDQHGMAYDSDSSDQRRLIALAQQNEDVRRALATIAKAYEQPFRWISAV